MAAVNCVCVVADLSLLDGSVNGTNCTLVANVMFQPTTGLPGIQTGINIVGAYGSLTAAQWKSAILNAVKAFAAAPVGFSPGDTINIVRLLGLVDLVSVVP